jgi:hypothetical protein
MILLLNINPVKVLLNRKHLAGLPQAGLLSGKPARCEYFQLICLALSFSSWLPPLACSPLACPLAHSPHYCTDALQTSVGAAQSGKPQRCSPCCC